MAAAHADRAALWELAHALSPPLSVSIICLPLPPTFHPQRTSCSASSHRHFHLRLFAGAPFLHLPGAHLPIIQPSAQMSPHPRGVHP